MPLRGTEVGRLAFFARHFVEAGVKSADRLAEFLNFAAQAFQFLVRSAWR